MPGITVKVIKGSAPAAEDPGRRLILGLIQRHAIRAAAAERRSSTIVIKRGATVAANLEVETLIVEPTIGGAAVIAGPRRRLALGLIQRRPVEAVGLSGVLLNGGIAVVAKEGLVCCEPGGGYL